MSHSKYEFFKEASLSQKLAHKMPEYSNYAGSDPEPSLAIARLTVLGQFGLVDMKDPTVRLVFAMLNEERKALFATSEKTNEITKMGLQMPKAENIISEYDEEE